MHYQPHTVSGPAADAVADLFYLGGYQPEHARERLVPDGVISLVVELDGQERFVFDNETGAPAQSCRVAWVSGVHTGFLTIGSLPDTELMAVRFRPGHARPVLHHALGAITDRVVSAMELIGGEIAELRRDLLAIPQPTARLQAFESWLNRRWDSDYAPPEHIIEIVQVITDKPTVATVTRAFDASPHSHRHTVNQFRDHVGVTPKAFQRILRFAEVMPRVVAQEKVDWAALADECGYFDQAHLSRDFAAFSGLSPARFKAASDRHGEQRTNFFPMDDY